MGTPSKNYFSCPRLVPEYYAIFVLENSIGLDFCASQGAEHKNFENLKYVIFITFVWRPSPKIIFDAENYYQNFLLFLCCKIVSASIFVLVKEPSTNFQNVNFVFGHPFKIFFVRDYN